MASGTASPPTEASGRLSPTARTEAFSDGVFAIAITLLVLEVHAPSDAEIRAAHGLAPALLAGWPSYLSYVATFLTVAVIWLNHHAVFEKIRRIDTRIQWWNIVLLMAVSFTPFPNALVAAHLAAHLGDGLFSEPARTATVVYALVFVVATVPWIVIWAHLRAHPDLLEDGWDARYARLELRRSSIGFVLYLVATLVALLVPLAAVALYLALAVFYGVTSRGSRADARPL